VNVSARESGGNAVISVKNSGSEIDEDIMRKLNSGERISEGHGIGLMNIDARIKLLFGESYGLDVENGLDGVIISMRLPLPQKAAEGASA
jgi:sensor histidine kinase YesM